MPNIRFDAPPTVARFMKSNAFVRIIAGPVGSGKTTGCLFELFRRAAEQAPGQDGLRYTRFAILRQTLSQLKTTVLKDITTWLKGMAEFKVSENTIYISVGDIRSEWVLIPLEDTEDQRRLLSMQLTGAWISECIEIDVDLVAPITGRCARYPSGVQGVPTWAGVIADTNMPAEGSEWHKNMELSVPPDWQIFIQPGGLDADAENLEWLNQTAETVLLPANDNRRRAQGRIYYERLARNPNPDWVKRYVNAKYGDDPSGTAVFRASFRRQFHVRPELMPSPGHPLIVGQDFGRDPWSVICQLDHKGRFLILEEVPAEDIGLELHIAQSLRPALMQERYLGFPIAIIGDPAGAAKNSLYEVTSFDLLKEAGFRTIAAPTNDLDPRLRAVESFLLAQRDGGPALLVDERRCPTIVRAFSGGYRFGKTRAGERKAVPDKGDFSHPMDSVQYAALAANGGQVAVLARRLIRTRRAPARRVASGGWT